MRFTGAELWDVFEGIVSDYSNATKFYDDFKLMIRNCFQFNPAGTPVNQAGIELQRMFDEKWKGLPPMPELEPEDEEPMLEEESDDDRSRMCIPFS